MQNNNETLLKVENLCQYFKMEGGELKAVDNVSFEIKRGEVFGLVGESGCGKTTTGRSIIKLYNITSGNVIFKGIRICAGTRSYKNAIKEAKANFEAESKGKSAEEVAELQKKRDEIIRKNREEIQKAQFDQRNCDKEYSKVRVEELKEEWLPKIEKAEGNEKKELQKEYRNEL